MSDDETMNDDDQRLDAVVSQLRQQPIPAVPAELLDANAPVDDVEPRSVRRRNGQRMLSALLAVAAVALFLVRRDWTGDNADPANPNEPRVARQNTLDEKSHESTGVTVVALRQLRPYSELESGLDQMEAEIAELKQRVALLDVLRQTESLLARN